MAHGKKISFDVNPKALKKLDDLAKLADRPRAYMLNELLDLFIEDLTGFHLAANRLKHPTESDLKPLGQAWEMIQQKRNHLGKGAKR